MYSVFGRSPSTFFSVFATTNLSYPVKDGLKFALTNETSSLYSVTPVTCAQFALKFNALIWVGSAATGASGSVYCSPGGSLLGEVPPSLCDLTRYWYASPADSPVTSAELVMSNLFPYPTRKVEKLSVETSSRYS